VARTYAQGPEAVAVDASHTVTTRLWERAASPGGAHVLRYATPDGWAGLDWAGLGERVRAVAAGLIAAGIQPGDRVALMSATRMEWTITDLAILSAGAVTVPIYETSSPEQCAWILSDSGARVAIVETADQACKLESASDHAPGLGELFVIEDGGLDTLAGRGLEEHRARVPARASAPRQGDLATIVYTSGTTGRPKGCMLTHGNLVWNARQGELQLRQLLGQGDATLLFIPLAHIFARHIQFTCLESGVTIGYARSIATLADDIASFRPTFVSAVPRMFERVFNAAQHKARGPKARVFDFAVRASTQWSGTQRHGLAMKLQHAIADRLVYAKLRAALGGRLRYGVSGGAALAPHLASFFHAAGITILEGYGLTETTSPAAVNTPNKLRFGTVGAPMPGVEVKIGGDGEVLVRGGNVFAGYFHDDAATTRALDADGWFHTGDIGDLDDAGFLRITGRLKELIVTATGKNVAPAMLEERVKEHRLVSQAMVVGDNRPYIGCLITLDPDELALFAASHGLALSADLPESDAVRSEVAKAVERANAAVSTAESIRRWKVLPRDFSQEDNEITPSLKLRRNVVSAHFSDEIDALYQRRRR